MCRFKPVSKQQYKRLLDITPYYFLFTLMFIVATLVAYYKGVNLIDNKNDLFVKRECKILDFIPEEYPCGNGVCYKHEFDVEYTIDESLYNLNINRTRIFTGYFDHRENLNINLPVGGKVTCYYNKCRLNPLYEQDREACSLYGKNEVAVFDLENNIHLKNTYYALMVIAIFFATCLIYLIIRIKCAIHQFNTQVVPASLPTLVITVDAAPDLR